MKILELDSAELAAWRKKRAEEGDLVRTPALSGGGFAPGWSASPVVEGDIPEPYRPPPPRPARDTMESVLNFVWSNMRRDRQSYYRAIRWLRLRVPDAVAHLTDTQLFDHVRKLSEESTQRVLSRKGLIRPNNLDGKW